MTNVVVVESANESIVNSGKSLKAGEGSGAGLGLIGDTSDASENWAGSGLGATLGVSDGEATDSMSAVSKLGCFICRVLLCKFGEGVDSSDSDKRSNFGELTAKCPQTVSATSSLAPPKNLLLITVFCGVVLIDTAPGASKALTRLSTAVVEGSGVRLYALLPCTADRLHGILVADGHTVGSIECYISLTRNHTKKGQHTKERGNFILNRNNLFGRK